ncbi:MAG: hypothetical protein ACOX79_00745 [Methanosarcina sp.]
MEKHNENRDRSEKMFFFHSEAATSTVIGAILLLGIIFSVLTVIYVGCVPEWKSDAEYSHMGDVCEDMAKVKSKIDLMSIILASNPNSSNLNSTNPSSSAPQLVMSVPFHMGGGSIPLLGPIKSSGSLAVNKENCTMGIVVVPEGSNNYSRTVHCGSITYNSLNRYYVDQNFSYENGALILDQKEQSVMMLYPSIRFSKALDGDKYDVYINSMRIFQKPYVPPEVISSNRECSLRLIGIDYRPLYDSNIVGNNLTRLELTVYTKHPEAWEQYFKKIAKDANIVPGTDCDIVPGEQNFYTAEGEKTPFVRLTFPKEKIGTKGLKGLYVSETVVKAELGIGLN